MTARSLALIGCLVCSLFSTGGRADEKGADQKNWVDTASADRGIAKGISGNKVLERLGLPKRISRQILLGRHLEQWTYPDPIGLRIELRGIRGQQLQVGSVHSLRSKKP
jgi:hypothetical protein